LARAALAIGGGLSSFEVPLQDAEQEHLLRAAVAALPPDESVLQGRGARPTVAGTGRLGAGNGPCRPGAGRRPGTSGRPAAPPSPATAGCPRSGKPCARCWTAILKARWRTRRQPRLSGAARAVLTPSLLNSARL
jgi:hypothetical protein